jgi:hypothetical protein
VAGSQLHSGRLQRARSLSPSWLGTGQRSTRAMFHTADGFCRSPRALAAAKGGALWPLPASLPGLTSVAVGTGITPRPPDKSV